MTLAMATRACHVADDWAHVPPPTLQELRDKGVRMVACGDDFTVVASGE